MNGFWSILELEPTEDASIIRRAYARKAKACHPEENPEEFLALRNAYQAALTYAASSSLDACREESQAERSENREADSEAEVSSAEPDGWYLPDEELKSDQNPYRDGAAIRQFVELYTKNQRKNPKLWMDYFSSDAFLDAAWDSRFTALLLEQVTEVEQTLPPNKEFLMWLCVAYQFSVKEELAPNREALRVETRGRKMELCPGADFDGMESILRIAAKGPLPKRPGGDELAFLESFKEYRHLVRMAEGGMWNNRTLAECHHILNRYTSFYIKDRCDPKANMEHQRHPASLRLLLHFFRREDLPEELYQEVWRKLDLKSAIMGRGKVLYGPLRELVMERIPGIEQKAPENFLQLNRDHDDYRARIKASPEREDEESAAFFDRPDFQKALRSRRFVTEQLLSYSNWRREGMGEGLVRRMLEFYQEHPEIPRAEEAEAGLKKDLLGHMARRRNREDAQAEAGPPGGTPTLAYRPFFRHWLNTAFYTAQDPETGKTLLGYLEENLPYQWEWSRRFAGRKATFAASFGTVEIAFCQRHMEYCVNGKPVYRPCLTWEQTEQESGDRFFLLLPLTAASCEQTDGTAREIAFRLADTAALEEDRAFLARCLAEAVCRLPWDEYTRNPVPLEGALPLERFAEDGEKLYGCSWYEGEGGLTLFEQTSTGRRVHTRRVVEPEEAAATARQLLEEAVSPTRFDLSRLELPWNVYFTAQNRPEQKLTRPDLLEQEEGEAPAEPLVTEEAIRKLLARFGRGDLRRLELRWFEGELVLIQEETGYACLYFEETSGYDMWYSMLSRPEVYQTVESDEVVYVPFGMGALADYCVHERPSSILREMDRVFDQLSNGRPQAQGLGGWLWASHVARGNGHHKLLMAKQKLGGFPPNRSRNHLAASFVLSQYPAQMETETLEGEQAQAEIRSGRYGLASAALVQFVQQKLARLRLTWSFQKVEGEPYHQHLVLLQDDGRFLMAWLQSDKQRADFCISEDAAETEEESFLGHSVPAVLIHRDLMDLRNCLDLLMDNIDHTEAVLERSEKFHQAEPYTEILELLRMTEE